MEEVLVFSIICLVCAWILRRWHDRHSILLGFKVPSVKWHLLFGFGALITPKDVLSTLTEGKKKYGKNFLMYVGPYPVFVTTDPLILKDILTSKQCINKDHIFYDNFENAIGEGLISSKEPKWSADRKILNIAFNNKNLMSFMRIFHEEINDLLKTIDKGVDSKLNTPLIDYFRKFTIEIATRTTTGRDLRKTQFKGKGVDHIRDALEYISTICMNYWYFIGIFRILAQKTYFKRSINTIDVMKSLITESMNGKAPRSEVNINTALDYISNGVKQNKIESERAVYNMMHIFAGAFETTSTSIYLIIILLAMHPEYQDRVYEEICQLFADEGDEEFEITYENVNQMVYLNMIMREMMRLFPVIPSAARKVTGGNIELSNGITLPEGQSVIIDIFNLHRSKDIWGPDADKFNPDNFLPGTFEDKHPYAYIPFTKGQRFCIGWRYGELSMKVALAKLIKRYKFSTTAKLEDLRVENHVSLHLKPDPPITIERRKKATNVI